MKYYLDGHFCDGSIKENGDERYNGIVNKIIKYIKCEKDVFQELNTFFNGHFFLSNYLPMKPTAKEDLSDITEEEENQSQEPIKNVLAGKDFARLVKKALKLGADSLDYSKRKNSKYVVTLKDGRKINFGSTKYEDYLIHHDEERKKKYLTTAKRIKNKQHEFTWENPNSANYWAIRFLWN